MMGITIHYRGTIDEVSRIEEMEDRVVDVSFALGGKATIWRSFADDDRARVIRGLMIDMAPGQETMSLLVSPEGDLMNLFEIEAAEKQTFNEPSWCFVKTQFGSLEGHIAIICLLDVLGAERLSPPKNDRDLIEEPSQNEPWRESLPHHAFDESKFREPEKHPALAQAESVLMEFVKTPSEMGAANHFVTAATRGLMDLVGGLVQATNGSAIMRHDRAHAIVQLKRALTDHALARGAVFGLRGCQAISRETSDRMHDEMESILKSIHQLLAEVWDESEW